MEVRSIKIADIDRSKALRAINQNWAQAMADEAREAGAPQWRPIEVVALERGYRLIKGNQRIEATNLLGLDEIEARVFDLQEFLDEAEIQLREIRSRMLTYPLTALDRAIHLIAWKEIYETANAVDRRGGKRRGIEAQTNSQDFAKRFSLAAANVLQISERSVQNAIKIAKGLSESVRRRISAHPLADNMTELLQLTGETVDRQEKIVGLMLSDPPAAAGVAEAIAIIDRMPVPRQLELWERTSASLLRLPDTQLDRVFDAMAPKIMAWMARQESKQGKAA